MAPAPTNVSAYVRHGLSPGHNTPARIRLGQVTIQRSRVETRHAYVIDLAGPPTYHASRQCHSYTPTSYFPPPCLLPNFPRPRARRAPSASLLDSTRQPITTPTASIHSPSPKYVPCSAYSTTVLAPMRRTPHHARAAQGAQQRRSVRVIGDVGRQAPTQRKAHGAVPHAVHRRPAMRAPIATIREGVRYCRRAMDIALGCAPANR